MMMTTIPSSFNTTICLKRNKIIDLLFIAFLISHTIITIDYIPVCHSFTTTSTTNPTSTGNRFWHDDSSKQRQQQVRHQRSKILSSLPTITYSPASFSTTRQQRLLAATSTENDDDDDDDANFDRNRRRNNLDDAKNNNNDDNASVKEIQQRLVQKGLTWNQSSLDSLPNMVRVPGCVATVYVLATVVTTTTTTTTEEEDDNENEGLQRRNVVPVVQLYGNSDAIVSRGLLSELADYLKQSSSIDEVLKLDPSTVADILGVRPALSRGRNDGLANMLEIIQKQLSFIPPYEELTLKNDVTDVINNNDNNTTIISSSSPSSLSSSLSSDNSNKKPTVALLLSGGVDSSVAFRLLLQQGYDVVPFYLKIWLEDELAHLGECPWEDDVQSCRDVCDQVNIELQIISLQDEYHKHVMQHTLNEASLGRTPNPDILCNSRVKFGCFLEYLKGLPKNNQFDYIASGHYAQVKRKSNNNDNCDENDDSDDGIARLYRAPDPVKDQSYFLCALDQYQLRRLLFPIGHLEKTEVRQLAEDFQLPNRNRPDSQGLCFLGKVKFRDFMQIHLGEKFGDLVDAVTGEIIGEHHGVWYHTIGQRKGIGPYLKPKATALGPWYVVAKDPSKNIVYASNKYDEDVFVQSRSEFHVESLHWISGKEPTHLLDTNGSYRLILKIRHGPKLAGGTLTVLEEEDDGIDNGIEDKSLHAANSNDNSNNNKRNGGIVKLEQRDGGLAPGQYVVFYTEDAECLGGGIISERHWAKFLLDTQSRAKTTEQCI